MSIKNKKEMNKNKTMPLKEIEKLLGKRTCWRSDNNQLLYIKCCAVGDNFYDYGERPPKRLDFSRAPYLKDDPRIEIIYCEDCCGCAGW